MKNLPEKFLERLARIVPANRLDAVLRSFGREKPPTFRVNTLKAEPRDVLERLKQVGFKLGNVPWMKEAFILQNRRQRDLEDTREYETGEIYMQNLSSMLPPILLEPRPGEEVLDLAAAPGGKAMQMAARMGGEGRITAVEDNGVRMQRLKANLERQGVPNVECLLADGARLGRERTEAYDRVLLDAPCSSEGRFLAGAPRTFSYWREERVRKLAREQKRLMLSALRALKAGGILVYSTCTFAPEENEGVVSWALERFGDVLETEPARLPLPNALPGLGSWEGKPFAKGMGSACRILPTDTMEGFFAVRIRKKGSLPDGKDRPGVE